MINHHEARYSDEVGGFLHIDNKILNAGISSVKLQTISILRREISQEGYDVTSTPERLEKSSDSPQRKFDYGDGDTAQVGAGDAKPSRAEYYAGKRG